MPPGHPIILLKSNKFNMAAVSVKRSIVVSFSVSTFKRETIFVTVRVPMIQSDRVNLENHFFFVIVVASSIFIWRQEISCIFLQ